ncbi:GNAT family N-acetyltransferase [Phycicoccus flavus]|uniref:GNAT family N-acetyltransferase n=1 Tax=Phycicoccus flavus TaxID=2502783 RepID=UPI000FEC0528|nr:GNAT family N-acetyltransferase [Phycicoccus flavus]NHA69385.1 hypothetical protein [Phycicoccus flavus]
MPEIHTGGADAALDQRLGDELDAHNAAATPGIGRALLEAFEAEARARGCTHVFATSFTFQAPDFYRRLAYVETFRWDALPTPGRDDVHLRKDLAAAGDTR